MNLSAPIQRLESRLADHVRRMPSRLMREMAQRAYGRGLAVTLPDGDMRPIPIGAFPVVVDDAEIQSRARLAATLTAATAKAARWRMTGPARAATLASFGDAERRLVAATGATTRTLAVARVDFLFGHALSALEVNATIPAMQGYSDIAAESWLHAFAPAPTARALVHANGSNAGALLQALVEAHRLQRRRDPRRIGLLCRRGDAQITELQHLAREFAAAGLDARLVHPDELAWRKGWLHHAGDALCLVYRHLFLSRLDRQPAPDVESALQHQGDDGTLVLNPPAPHLEMKSTLALLSQAAAVDRLADDMQLDAAERAAVTGSVPWTRRLAELDAGQRDEVEAAPSDFVLKRSWSYGGHDVFVGRAAGTPAFEQRVSALYPRVDDWRSLCRRAALDVRGDGFVVQQAIAPQRSVQWLCSPDSILESQVVTDYAAYASLGPSPEWGGVCRAAASDIVNIVGGGGVVPLLRASVARRVLESFAPG